MSEEIVELVKPSDKLSEMFDEFSADIGEIAKSLGCDPETLVMVRMGMRPIDPELAVRLEMAGLASAEYWLDLENKYHLYHLRKNPPQDVKKLYNPVVDFENYAGDIKNFVYLDRGKQAREILNLDFYDAQDTTKGPIDFIFPKDIYAVTASFCLGMLKPSIDRFGGVEGFKKHYRLVASPLIMRQLEFGLKRCAMENSKNCVSSSYSKSDLIDLLFIPFGVFLICFIVLILCITGFPL